MTATAEGEVQSYPWWLVLIQGIAAIILGVLLISSTRITTVILIQLLGLYWLIDGIFSIIRIFLKNAEISWGWLLARGILGILAGILVLRHPLWSTLLLPAMLVIILGFQGLIGGAIGTVQAFKGAGWGAGILGMLGCLFGLILLFNPFIGGLILPYVVGIFAIIGGIAALVMAFKLK